MNGIGHVKYQPTNPLRSSDSVAVLRTHTRAGDSSRSCDRRRKCKLRRRLPCRSPHWTLRATIRKNVQLPARLQRQIVAYSSREAPGTVIIDTQHTHLFYVLGNGKAIRYGIGVGREGFTWSGVKSIVRKTEWPDWYPPSAMIARQPYLPRMIAGGPGNPLGARAMYIGGTEYRIHGTNDPSSIGKHISSGCIRMTNNNVIDLYNRVSIGAKVIVLPIQLANVGQQ